MTALTTVPLTITPEAADRVRELGMQAELERMLDHTRRCVPDLQSIAVLLAPPYDTGDDLGILIEAMRKDPHAEDDPSQREWEAWEVQTFPPEVCLQFGIMVLYGPTDAR